MNTHKLKYYLAMAGLALSIHARAQFQMSYPRASTTNPIEAYDIHRISGGFQLLALNGGKQEIIEVNTTGDWVTDHSVNIGTSWSLVESRPWQ